MSVTPWDVANRGLLLVMVVAACGCSDPEPLGDTCLYWTRTLDVIFLPANFDPTEPRIGAVVCVGEFESSAEGLLPECNLVLELYGEHEGVPSNDCEELVGTVLDPGQPTAEGRRRCLVPQVSALPYRDGSTGTEEGWYFDDFSPRSEYWGCTPDTLGRGWGLINYTPGYLAGRESLLAHITLECDYERCSDADAGQR